MLKSSPLEYVNPKAKAKMFTLSLWLIEEYMPSKVRLEIFFTWIMKNYEILKK